MASATDKLSCTNDFSGLRPFLEDGALSDITVALPDGKVIRAHRVILAASSDVLKAKFVDDFHDSSEQVWAPGVGSSSTWQWVLGWMYGSEEPLPADDVVEAVLLADHFQMTGLLAKITALPLHEMAQEIAQQLLQAWACPNILMPLAQWCVPLVAHDPMIWGLIHQSRPQHVALFVRFLPVLSEADRLSLLGDYLRMQERDQTFPDAFVDAVSWDSFPVNMIEAALGGDFTEFETLAGVPMRASSIMREALHAASLHRCRSLELICDGRCPQQEVTRQRGERYLLSLGTDLLAPPAEGVATGLFALLSGRQLGVDIHLSSRHNDNATDHTVLFRLDTTHFGTGNQSEVDPPWIEVYSSSCVIRPLAVGLKHGWSNYDCCRSFVVEAASGSGGEWRSLVEHVELSLKADGEVLPVNDEAAPRSAFF